MKAFTDFADLVAEMRSAQKDYFKSRVTSGGQTTEKLDKAKELERKVDKALVDINKTKPDVQQISLF